MSHHLIILSLGRFIPSQAVYSGKEKACHGGTIIQEFAFKEGGGCHHMTQGGQEGHHQYGIIYHVTIQCRLEEFPKNGTLPPLAVVPSTMSRKKYIW